MNRGELLEKLGLESSASNTEIEAAVSAKSEALNQAMDAAPTEVLRNKYQQQLDGLTRALASLRDEPAAVAKPSFSQTKFADLPRSATQFDDGATSGIQLERGLLLADRYTIEERIGEGGMGAVFRAHDKNRDQDIAIKVLLPSLLNSPAAKERFMDEARISSTLSHPNIVNVYDVQNDGDLFFITMELLEGQNLRDYMENLELTKQQMSPQEAIEFADEICEGLLHAHEHTVHRDIKPENIWITGEGKVKLMDFGIARVMSSSQMTKTGAAMGTAYYMAPEQLKGRMDIDGRADQYALGVMLYEMLSGQIPAGRVESLHKVNKQVGKHLSAVVDKMLAGNPDDRYATMAEVKTALTQKPKFTLPSIAVPGAGKFAVAAALLAVIGIGALAGTGNLKKAWDMVRPYSQEEILAFKSEQASAQGKIKALVNRLDGARESVRDQERDLKFEIRQLENDINRAGRSERKALEKKLEQSVLQQRLLEAQEELLTNYIIDSNKRGELDGLMALGEELMRAKKYEKSIGAYQQAVAGYENLLAQAEATEGVAEYKYASQREKSTWEKTAPEYGIETIPFVDALQVELTAAYEHLQNVEFAQAAPILERVAVGYVQATEAIVSGSDFKASSTEAKQSWEAYAADRGLQSRFTGEYASAFDTAEAQWAQGDLVPASATYKTLYDAYTELESAARNAGALKLKASRAKGAWDTYRARNKMMISLTDQYASEYVKAESDFKNGEVVDAAKLFSELEKKYVKLMAAARKVNANLGSVSNNKSVWEGHVKNNYAKANRAEAASRLYTEGVNMRKAGSWTEAADKLGQASSAYAKLNSAVDKHRKVFKESYSAWESKLSSTRSNISSLERKINSLSSDIYDYRSDANASCSRSGWSAFADGLNSASCEMGCNKQVWNGTYYETRTDNYCVSSCRNQAAAKQRQVEREYEQCQSSVASASRRLRRAESDISSKRRELSSEKSTLSRLQKEKPVFSPY
ncbi:protein kinase [Microbulbifer elongatus]|uniref:Protein kinase n=1 Tax=Microbulbifer elongatus TaxID=86173 RepID=A0ABT1P1N3_9GAMM|nr:serine/threonine-protein kinase [Microbulbifer elongatus]MCQ3830020.1 protein kinase [Microbulbifer elongatus]